MDPQELLALMGYTDAPAEPAPVPHDGNYSAQVDFQPQTFDFGDAPQTVEYNQAGTPAPVAPVMPPTPEEMEPEPARPGMSISRSTQGYSPQRAAKIEAGPYGKSQSDQIRQSKEAQIRAGYADEQAAMAGADQAQLAAADEVSRQETFRAEEKARADAKKATFFQEQEQGMRTIYESGRIAANQAKNEYLMRLSSIPEMNPNALWDEAGDTGRFQIAAAAVIHNMLGVKGINTTAMDTINQAIKNKIDAQIYNINNKKAVAQGFKDLYEMTVAESASQLEVEAKMQGYLLKAFEAGIDAEMGKYDSNVARAKHAYAKTELHKAQIENRLKVEKYIQDGTQQAVDTEVGLLKAKIAAAVQRDGYASAERIANANRKPPEVKSKRVVRDPETGIAKWEIVDWAKDEKAAQILTDVGKFEAANKTMNEIRELERKMKPVFDPLSGTRLAPEDARRYTAKVNTLAHQLVTARGERPTDKDIEQQLKALPTNTDFTRGAVDKILADTQAGLRNEVIGVVGQFVKDLPSEEQTPGPNMDGFAQGSKTDTDIVRRGDGKGQTPAEAAVARAIAPEAAYVGKIPGSEQTAEWKEFTQPYWSDFLKEKKDFLDKHSYTNDPSSKGVSVIAGHMSPANPPTAFDEIRELAEDAYGGDDGARNYLRELGASGRSTDLPPALQNLDKKERSALAAYAEYFEAKLEKASKNSKTGYENAEFGYEEDKPVTRPR